LLPGLVTSKGIVTHDFGLDDYAEAFALADSTRSIKVLLKPAGQA
jgi:L-iditol 2-dehydrogenase